MNELQHIEDDGELVRLAHGGNQEAFAALIQRYQAPLRLWAGRFVTSRDEAWDLVQDVFLVVWRDLASFDSSRPFAPWIRGICRHKIQNYIRTRYRRHQVGHDFLLNLAGTTPDDETENDHSQEINALRSCLAELSVEQRELLRLRYDDGLALAELEQRYAKKSTALAMSLARIRTALLICMQRRLVKVSP